MLKKKIYYIITENYVKIYSKYYIEDSVRNDERIETTVFQSSMFKNLLKKVFKQTQKNTHWRKTLSL